MHCCTLFLAFKSYGSSLAILKNEDLVSSFDNTIKIWNVNDGSLKKTLLGHIDFVESLSTLSNGDLVSNKTIKIWNVNDGSVKKTLSVLIFKLVVVQNGDLVSVSGVFIKIWDVNSGTVKRYLTGHTNYVRALAVLQNGDLVSGSDDSTINIWNANDGSLIRT